MTLYQESQEHILQADGFLVSGDVVSARKHFLQAADLQWKLVNSLPSERIRTSAVFALSSATLYFRGNALDEAEHIIHALLAGPGPEDHIRRELQELLARIWNERQMEKVGFSLPAKPLSVVFSRGQILHGLAPTDAVDTPIRSILNIFHRLAAWKIHLPLTKQPQHMLAERYRALTSEPILGSYRVDLYLAQDQMCLDLDDPSLTVPTTDEVMNDLIGFLRHASADHYDELCSMVPDEPYRTTLIRLMRNIVPDGRQVGEVEFRRAGENKESAVVLRPAHRDQIRSILRKSAGPEQIGSSRSLQTQQRKGVLRAVDLDFNLLRLDSEGDKLEFTKAEDIMDDVVGPMLNKLVVITGSFPKGRKKFRASDIELAAGFEDSSASI